jgi:hypothetical protein
MKTIDDILKEIEDEQMAKALKKDAPTHKEPDGDEDLEDEDYSGFEDDDEDDEDAPKMTKSFGVTLADGTQAEAFDGTALIKSLTDQVNSQQDELSWLTTDLTKALGGLTDLVKAQGEEIASLHTDLNRLRKAGKGAQSVMMAKAESDLPKQDLMTKAFAAKNAGAINSTELGIVDASMRHGVAIDPAVLAKIQSI